MTFLVGCAWLRIQRTCRCTSYAEAVLTIRSGSTRGMKPWIKLVGSWLIYEIWKHVKLTWHAEQIRFRFLFWITHSHPLELGDNWRHFLSAEGATVPVVFVCGMEGKAKQVHRRLRRTVKMISCQLVKHLVCYETRWFIAMFASASHWNLTLGMLDWVRSFQVLF